MEILPVSSSNSTVSKAQEDQESQIKMIQDGDDARLKISGIQSQKTKAQDQDHRSMKEQSHYKEEKTKTQDQKRQSSKSNEDNLYIGGDC
ncbi:hypothetical protein Tco_0834729 [Tanacetum coccineum]